MHASRKQTHKHTCTRIHIHTQQICRCHIKEKKLGTLGRVPYSCSQNIAPDSPIQPVYNPYIGGIKGTQLLPLIISPRIKQNIWPNLIRKNSPRPGTSTSFDKINICKHPSHPLWVKRSCWFCFCFWWRNLYIDHHLAGKHCCVKHVWC